MRRNPLYVFRDRSSVGIYDVPLKSTIQILDGGDGKPRFVEIQSKDGLGGGSNIGDFLDRPELYIDLFTVGEIPSELEKIEENGKTGWRILGRDPQYFGNIGNQAIDLSYSNEISDNGATGTFSVAIGANTQAKADASFAAGEGTIASETDSVAIGRYNVGDTVPNTNNILEVGIGADEYRRKNGLEVKVSGEIIAPEMDTHRINNSTSTRILVTKEYADDIDGGSIV